MKKIVIFYMALLLCGCSSGMKSNDTVEKSQTIIEWADFIKINERKYEALYTLAIADEKYIGEKAGTVKFNVSENIDNPEYRVKEGDAAFLKKGTPIYYVEDMPDIVAVKDKNSVNNYRLYQANDSKRMWNFEHIKQDEISRVEIYIEQPEPELVNAMKDKKEIQDLLSILIANGERIEEKTDVSNEDPVVYYLVFYDERPVASYYPLFHEGDYWYWHPWEEEIIPDEIEAFLIKD